jgi:hypothetical protein
MVKNSIDPQLRSSIGGRGIAAAVALSVLMNLPARAADRDHPTVVELFQSQGCSSCPPANANVIALSERPDILALSFEVTYWDSLGWKDTFGSPQYTRRQWDYAHAFHRSEVFTPEVVVNGRSDAVGQDRGELETLISRNARAGADADIVIGDGIVNIGSGQERKSADVWLVRFDPNIVQVAITRGENEGRTLPHKNVVRELVKLGAWSGRATSFKLPPPSENKLSDAILIQDSSGAIVAAARR